MKGVLQVIRRAAELPRGARAALVALIDVLVCCVAAILAFWLRLGEWYLFEQNVQIFIAIAVPIWLAIAIPSHTYRSLVRFSGRETLLQLAKRCLAMSLVLTVVLLTLRVQGIPRTLAVLHPLVFMLALAGRLGWASAPCWSRRFTAGLCGRGASASSSTAPDLPASSWPTRLARIRRSRRSASSTRIRCCRTDRSRASRSGTPTIWSGFSRSRTSTRCSSHCRARAGRRAARSSSDCGPGRPRSGCGCSRALPRSRSSKVSINDLRDVQIEELLGRDEVAPDPELMSRNIAGKCVMVTGAGGSIGSELCRQIIREAPRAIILVEQSEHALYLIDSELRELREREKLGIEIAAELVDVAQVAECSRALRGVAAGHGVPRRRVQACPADRGQSAPGDPQQCLWHAQRLPCGRSGRQRDPDPHQHRQSGSADQRDGRVEAGVRVDRPGSRASAAGDDLQRRALRQCARLERLGGPAVPPADRKRRAR